MRQDFDFDPDNMLVENSPSDVSYFINIALSKTTLGQNYHPRKISFRW